MKYQKETDTWISADLGPCIYPLTYLPLPSDLPVTSQQLDSNYDHPSQGRAEGTRHREARCKRRGRSTVGVESV